MSLRKKSRIISRISLLILTSSVALIALSASTQHPTLAAQLGWIESPATLCGGYYLEQPFPMIESDNNMIETIGNQGVFSFHGTSIIEGKIIINRAGQQITANKALLYRDPTTNKLSMIDLIGNVNLREPNTLIVGKKGSYNFVTKTKSFNDILYRTSINEKMKPKIKAPTAQEAQKERKITQLTAWGKAYEFSQTQPNVYELTKASFSTCPPNSPSWRVKASHLVLDKNTGRGYATHARLLVKNIPVFYVPYLNFSIDGKRKSGFLWPTLGASNKWGAYFLAPFYWNIAPDKDMTLTPGILSKRGIQISDRFRYLTPTSRGELNLSILPSDRLFADFQKKIPDIADIEQNSLLTAAEINRLQNASTTRKGFSFVDHSQFNQHWSAAIDFNYASDDYYYRDFGNLNEINKNQLLQQADLYYKGQNWNFIGRVQAYQTLHPYDEPLVTNQYRRFPQLILDVNYPDQLLGLAIFSNAELTHFDIRKTPGLEVSLPIGNRMHFQPGLSLPISKTYFSIYPRVQLALTDYALYQTTPTHTPNMIRRALPIFDIAAKLDFTRETSLFRHAFRQTLEPQIYYTYIPYRNQSNIPIFDTTVNTLTYDQLFNYNRFSGIDRLGDANQIGVGVSTHLIDNESGYEKIRLGAGQLIYFRDRRVTLCNNAVTCTDYPVNPENHYRLSPISAFLNYNVDPSWSVAETLIWSTTSKQVDNSTLNVHYQPDTTHILNFGFSYVRNGNSMSGILTDTSANNLKLTDISFAWPLVTTVSAVGRWSEDWGQRHFQNLLFGVQYDTCCYALRLVGGKAFSNLAPNGTPQYNNEFYIQFALKGLGNLGSGNNNLLNTISGYQSQSWQEF